MWVLSASELSLRCPGLFRLWKSSYLRGVWLWRHFRRQFYGLHALLQLRSSAPGPPLVSGVSVFCRGDLLPIIWLQYGSSTSGLSGARRAWPLSDGEEARAHNRPPGPPPSVSFTRARTNTHPLHTHSATIWQIWKKYAHLFCNTYVHHLSC